MDITELEKKARKIRYDIIKMIAEAGSGHPGGSLSCADMMTALYFHQLRHRPQDPLWLDRDRVVLSKGHSAPVLYACLAESGYFSSEKLLSLRKLGSCLQGHPSCRDLAGLEVSTGSLGMGLSVAVGIALGVRQDHRPSRIYCVMGDGEIQEGQIWEAAMAGAHYRLDNLCGIVDNNGLQIDGRCEDVMNINPVAEKWRAFGWHTLEIDGHNFAQILEAYREAEATKGRPTLIVAKTIKGKGVSFMENREEWHGKAPNKELTEKALKELS